MEKYNYHIEVHILEHLVGKYKVTWARYGGLIPNEKIFIPIFETKNNWFTRNFTGITEIYYNIKNRISDKMYGKKYERETELAKKYFSAFKSASFKENICKIK